MKHIAFVCGFAVSAVLLLPFAHISRADGSITYDNTNFGSNAPDSYGTDANPDSSYPFIGRRDFILHGSIRRVDRTHNRIVVFSENDRRYNVDDYDADIRLNDEDAALRDLHQGMKVRITGRLLGRSFLEADRIRAVSYRSYARDESSDQADSQDTDSQDTRWSSSANDAGDNDAAAAYGGDESSAYSEPVGPPVPAAPAVEGVPISTNAVITEVSSDGRHITVLDDSDHRLVADTLGTDIILPGTDREGAFADLDRGMHVRLIGTKAADGSVQADRIRVQPAPPPPSVQPASEDSVAALEVPSNVDLSQYTGILIDARDLPAIQRSPSPTLVSPDGVLIYPNRSDVPTPNEVQSESIVRYYHTLYSAEAGVAGTHPLILQAIGVVGDASDGLELSGTDAALFQALDSRLRFTHTWKVGFLMPLGR